MTAPTTELPGLADEATDPAWLAVVSLSLTVFGLVTAEFLPASLLTPIAHDLGISEGLAGQAATATAVIGAVAAPSMAIVTRGLDRRLVMLGLTTLLAVSNSMAAVATSFWLLLIARLLLGISLGGFWSMAAALAMRLVPPHLMPRAMSLILTGVSLATVTAAPVGATIGHLWGWRAAFWVAGAVGILALILQAISLPRLPALGSPGLRTLFQVLRLGPIRVGLLIVLLLASGHFAGFTYFRPFLEEVPQVGVGAISAILLAYGIGGFLGNFAGAFVTERSLRAAVALPPLLIALSALSLFLFGADASIAAVAVALWGFGFGGVPVGTQTWMTRAAPDEAESAGGLFIAVFQVAIALGATLGGALVDHGGPRNVMVYSALTMLAAALIAFVYGRQKAA